jgi:riboflavin biosynthesis pyrimidine reductase
MSALATCRQRIQSLYSDDLRDDGGTIQAVSTWGDPKGASRVIAIGEEAPKSSTDLFVLGLTRSRADAVVTTGNLLRAEPRLTHLIEGPTETQEQLGAWRREFLRRDESPLSLVLTSGQALDFNHPFFQTRNPCVIYTTEDSAERLRAPAQQRAIEVVGCKSPSLRGALTWLREQREARTISIEAGPTTSLTAYKEPVAVQEILYSVYHEAELPEKARGPIFLGLDDLKTKGFQEVTRVTRQEQSGRWSFIRLVRRSS